LLEYGEGGEPHLHLGHMQLFREQVQVQHSVVFGGNWPSASKQNRSVLHRTSGLMATSQLHGRNKMLFRY
jgi:hypothetical protein